MQDAHYGWLNVNKKRISYSICRTVVAIDDVTQVLGVQQIYVVEDCAFKRPKEN